MRVTTSTILMIEPVAFRFNPDAARTNRFMCDVPGLEPARAQALALGEFRSLVETLEREGVEVLVRADTLEPLTPDSIFPNNWVSFHGDGRVFIYPMEPENRRLERRADLIDWLREAHGFRVEAVVDLTEHEQKGRFLEGTGSMVFDRRERIVYACLSPRTTPSLLEAYAERYGYRLLTFRAVDRTGTAIYHTNVVMAVGSRTAVICGESILEETDRRRVLDSLRSTGHEIVDLSMTQLHAFAGNVLELHDRDGASLIVMSERARDSLTSAQASVLGAHARLVSSPIPTIEDCGGGSVRCMIAEVFLPRD